MAQQTNNNWPTDSSQIGQGMDDGGETANGVTPTENERDNRRPTTKQVTRMHTHTYSHSPLGPPFCVFTDIVIFGT